MAEAAASWEGDSFAEFAFFNKKRIREAATVAPEVVEVLVLGYKLGITDGSGACVNDLGALYYMGDLVEQDYVKAAELYEMAAGGAAMKSICPTRPPKAVIRMLRWPPVASGASFLLQMKRWNGSLLPKRLRASLWPEA